MRKRERDSLCVCDWICMCVQERIETSLWQCECVHMQYHTPTHWQRGGATSAGCRTHDDDDFVDFPSTPCTSICKDGGVICLLAVTPSSVTTQKQRKNVTFTGYRHTSLSGRVSMNGSWCTYGFIMAHTHMWTLLVTILLWIPPLVCVLCVSLCDCTCVWQRSQASLRATMAAQENRMQVARQDNQI